MPGLALYVHVHVHAHACTCIFKHIKVFLRLLCKEFWMASVVENIEELLLMTSPQIICDHLKFIKPGSVVCYEVVYEFRYFF